MSRDAYRGGAFPATRWSMVAAAGTAQDAPSDALAQLCRLYWPPLYAFARYRGFAPSAAEDIVQGFLLHIIESGAVAHADKLRGTFRSFLIGCFKHYMADQRSHDTAQKRGGRQAALSLDTESIEDALLQDSQPTPDANIEKLVDRQWAMVVMRQALAVLAARYVDSRRESFEILRPSLALDGDGSSYETYAARLNMSVPAAKSAIFRLRREFRDVLRAEIAQTVASPQDVDQEIRDLLAALAAD
jgi:DNA-directed RNA polymerase specialized sigma24 family protein